MIQRGDQRKKIQAKYLLDISLITVLLAVLTIYDNPPASANSPNLISGWFTIIWGDVPAESAATIAPAYYITEESGKATRLILDEALAVPFGGVLALDRRKVTVQGMLAAASPAEAHSAESILHVDSISFEKAQQTKVNNVEALINGSRPFISIMCKFPDISTEPKDLSYFQGMYDSTYPGLDHYWRELSYDTANILGSNAVGWYTLPQPSSYYIYNNTVDLTRLAQDCTAMADAQVDFPNFGGINLMFNSDIGGAAWGGGFYLTLDGVSKVWAMTWEPPWAYKDISVISHEMGHGFGLPHSSGSYGYTYDNQWDVMSYDRINCNLSSDATYGCLGQHTISFHKDLLGWIPSEQKFTPERNTQATITLEQLALPQTNNYKMAQIPINGSSSHFYSVEARRKTGYDYKLPGQGVIIHEVDTTRSRPAYVIDQDLNGNTGDAGAIWTEGEVFSDVANGVTISVILATATGFQLAINYAPPQPEPFDKSYPEYGVFVGTIRPTLLWQTASGASSYELCVDEIYNNACDTAWVSTGTATAFTFNTDLKMNTNYYWQVRALNEKGTTESNDGWWFFNTQMQKPSNLRSIGSTINTATIAWDNVTNATGYKIYRWDGIDSFDFYATVNSSLTSFTDTGLSCNSWYYYEVSAYNGAMESEHAGLIYADTASCSISTTTSVRLSTTTSIGSTTTTSVRTIFCPVLIILGEDNQKLKNLRDFRDSSLANSAVGRKVIQIYYNNADSINAALDHNPALRAFTKRVLEVIAPMVGNN